MNTREEWLTAAVAILDPLADAGVSVPAVRVSVGFPKGTRGGNGGHAIGQCWHGQSAADGTPQLFISPELGDPSRVLDVLAHELIHAALGAGVDHKGLFRKTALAVGLTGKMTATVAGPDFLALTGEVLAVLGEYPHAALSPSRAGRKVQGTRMVKCECAHCGYTCRTTRKWLDEAGTPICPACGVQMFEAV